MRSVMKRICLSLAVIAVLIFTGCGQKKTKDPITVTLWHVYGGQTESPLNDLIDQFNETIGKEENIWVQVGSVTNTNTIHENVLASAFGDPGASELPDMFVSYPKTVLAMPDDTELVDYYDYFTEEELKHCINSAYDSKFDTEVIAPLVKVGDTYHLELFHGATIAFKDMALSILPHLMITSARKNQVKNDIVILTATSGDTGKAALAGFADVPGTKIIVFYPKGGVSHVQELQMVTQKGENTSVVAIHGNFDNAQSGVKAIFEDKELAAELDAKGYQFSSANSINIGRLVPQIVYYVYAYASLVRQGKIKDGQEMFTQLIFGDGGLLLRLQYHVGNHQERLQPFLYGCVFPDFRIVKDVREIFQIDGRRKHIF